MQSTSNHVHSSLQEPNMTWIRPTRMHTPILRSSMYLESVPMSPPPVSIEPSPSFVVDLNYIVNYLDTITFPENGFLINCPSNPVYILIDKIFHSQTRKQLLIHQLVTLGFLSPIFVQQDNPSTLDILSVYRERSSSITLFKSLLQNIIQLISQPSADTSNDSVPFSSNETTPVFNITGEDGGYPSSDFGDASTDEYLSDSVDEATPFTSPQFSTSPIIVPPSFICRRYSRVDGLQRLASSLHSNRLVVENRRIFKKINSLLNQDCINKTVSDHLLEYKLIDITLYHFLTDPTLLDIMVVPITCYSHKDNQTINDFKTIQTIVENNLSFSDPKTNEEIVKVELNIPVLRLVNELLERLLNVLTSK